MTNSIAQIFGQVNPPPGIDKYGASLESGGPQNLLNNIVRLVIVAAGIYAFINLILAGYGFMSAGDDPKKIAAATRKIWQTLLGLAVVAGSFVLAALFGQVLFGDATALLQLRFVTP